MNKYQICEFINGNSETVYKVKVLDNEMHKERFMSMTYDTKAATINAILYFIDRAKADDIKLVSCEDYPLMKPTSDISKWLDNKEWLVMMTPATPLTQENQ